MIIDVVIVLTSLDIDLKKPEGILYNLIFEIIYPLTNNRIYINYSFI